MWEMALFGKPSSGDAWLLVGPLVGRRPGRGRLSLKGKVHRPTAKVRSAAILEVEPSSSSFVLRTAFVRFGRSL